MRGLHPPPLELAQRTVAGRSGLPHAVGDGIDGRRDITSLADAQLVQHEAGIRRARRSAFEAVRRRAPGSTNPGVEPRPQTDAAAASIADLPMEELPNT